MIDYYLLEGLLAILQIVTIIPVCILFLMVVMFERYRKLLICLTVGFLALNLVIMVFAVSWPYLF
ncbi:MAG: hypothetical protein ACTSRS_14855 [Candidatus Helarchaeota archaeon]